MNPQHPTPFKLFAVVLAAVAITTAIVGSTVAAKEGTPRGYCAQPLLRGYEKPFRHFLPLRHPPVDSPLPFGPRSIELIRDGASLEDRVLVGGGSYGYEIVDRANVSPHKLNWTVVASLVELSREGFSKGRLRRVKAHFNSTRGQADILLQVPPKAGFYRFDITFRKRDGVLGAFSEYLRVVDPVLDVRIGTMKSAYRPGDTLFARVENIGTEAVTYGAPYSIERLVDNAWFRVGPSTTVWPRYQAGLPAGGAGECMSYPIPANFPFGRYRIAKSLRTGDPASEIQLKLYAEFELRP